MTSHGISCPTTDTHKGNEIRVPEKLILNSYQGKMTKELSVFVLLKLHGSRVHAEAFFKKVLKVSAKTGKRIIQNLLAKRWIGFDGKYIFVRSWSRIGYKKRKGLYLAKIPKCITDFLFVHALKAVTKRKARAQEQRSAMPKGLTVRYYSKSLNISERTYYRNIRAAIKRGLLRTKQTFTKIGAKKDFNAFTKHLHGVPMFVRGNYTVTPNPVELKFLI